MFTDLDDSAHRTAAARQVARLVQEHGGEIPWQAIAAGYTLGGQRWNLASKAEGIYKPKGWPTALSIKTVMPRKGRLQAYNDELASDSATFRYAYKARGGPDNAANQSMRSALQRRRPLIYFWAVAPGVYTALCPVFVFEDDRNARVFHVVPSQAPPTAVQLSGTHAAEPDATRVYTMSLVRRRLHQSRFRRLVLDAYTHHCAMCSIKFDELLEAAHIVPDADNRGDPEVTNGLALCTLHHSAFDRHLIGIGRDLTVEVSPRFLKRRDGPIFQQAFLERHGAPLHLPRRAASRPDKRYLAMRRAMRPAALWEG